MPPSGLRRIAWVMHPYGGNRDNLARAKRWLNWLLLAFPEVDFAADWILWCELLDEVRHRERGLVFDAEMIRRCDEVFLVGGRVSEGMRRELDIARQHLKPIIDLTHFGEEPPPPGVGLGSV